MAQDALLKLQWGALTSALPTRSTASNGTMYVHVDSAGVDVATGIKTSYLYFDLGGQRYRVDSASAGELSNSVTLSLNGVAKTAFNGSQSITWNIPLAGADEASGLISNAAQTIAGMKTFSGGVTLSAASVTKGLTPDTTNTYDIGSSSLKYKDIYATRFKGIADEADMANEVLGHIIFQKDANHTKEYDGTQTITVTLEDLGGDDASRITTGTLPLSVIPQGALERLYVAASIAAAEAMIAAGTAQTGDLIKIDDPNNANDIPITYYVDADGDLVEFSSGYATEADHLSHTLTLQLAGTNLINAWDGGSTITANIPLAGTGVAAGLISNAAQSIYGAKTFADGLLTASQGLSVSGNAVFNGTVTASSSAPGIYPFVGNLDGTAKYADEASATAGTLKIFMGPSGSAYGATGTTSLLTGFNGSSNATVNIPFATASAPGVISAGEQSFGGNKTFSGATTLTGGATLGAAMVPASGASVSIGAANNAFNYVYANTFVGDLDGNASSATQVAENLTVSSSATGIATNFTYNGSQSKTIAVFAPATTSAAGKFGLVPAPAQLASGSYGGFLRANGNWATIGVGANGGLTLSDSANGITIAHNAPGTADSNKEFVLNPTTIMPGGSLSIPTFSCDGLGHVISVSSTTVSLFSITNNWNEGERIFTFSDGTNTLDIRSGVHWETF